MFYVATLYITEDRTTWNHGKVNIGDVFIVFCSFFLGAMHMSIINTSYKKIMRGIASARKILDLKNNNANDTEKLY